MKKNTSILLCLAALAVVGCDKGANPGAEHSAALVFSARNVQTKAVFSSDDDGTLEWSSYDNLGVYSFDAESSDFIHEGFASMLSFSGSEAFFTSADARADWAGEAASVKFYAYYPQINSPQASYDGGNVALTVPAVQNGEFGRYHICWAETDEFSKEQLLDDEEVNFYFQPKTSMLRVRPVLTADSDVEQLVIKQLIIKIADDKTLAGDASLALMDGELSVTGGVSSISVTLPSPAVITKTAADNPYITAVILPDVTDGAILSFEAIGVDGTSYTMQGKTSPASFSAGVRYNIDRNITVEITALGSPDSQYINAGNGWPAEEVEEDGAYTDGGIAW